MSNNIITGLTPVVSPPFKPTNQGETDIKNSGGGPVAAVPAQNPFNPTSQGQTITTAKVTWSNAPGVLPSPSQYIGPIAMANNINTNLGIINESINTSVD